MTVFLTSRGGQVMSCITWRRAATMLVADTAHNVDHTPLVTVVRSPGRVIVVHAVIMLRGSITRPSTRRFLDTPASPATILERDRGVCAYCGCIGANTVDHIIPQARNGPSTLGNQVAACSGCNGAKGCQSPDEAGMPLRYQPAVYDRMQYAQQIVSCLYSV